MSDLNSRLSEYCEVKNLRQADLVRLNCGSKQTVSLVFKGQKPSLDFITALAKNDSSLSLRWLITGKGEMNNTYKASATTIDTANEYAATCKACKEKERIINEMKISQTSHLKHIEMLELQLGKIKKAT